MANGNGLGTSSCCSTSILPASIEPSALGQPSISTKPPTTAAPDSTLIGVSEVTCITVPFTTHSPIKPDAVKLSIAPSTSIQSRYSYSVTSLSDASIEPSLRQ